MLEEKQVQESPVKLALQAYRPVLDALPRVLLVAWRNPTSATETMEIHPLKVPTVFPRYTSRGLNVNVQQHSLDPLQQRGILLQSLESENNQQRGPFINYACWHVQSFCNRGTGLQCLHL